MIQDNQLVMVYRGLAEIYRNHAKKACASSRIQSVVFPKKDELCAAVVSVAGHRYKVKHMQKEDALRIYNWYKEKETPVCNGVSFCVVIVDKSIYLKIADII